MLKNYVAATGAPLWIELDTADVAGSAEFYAQVFDWTVEEASGDFAIRSGRVAGLRSTDTKGLGWVVYLAAPVLDLAVDQAEGRGGEVLRRDERVAVVRDPAGATLGLAEPGAVPELGQIAEPGAPCWFELQTSRFDEALAFYAGPLAWPVRADHGEAPHRNASHGRGHSQRTSIIESTAPDDALTGSGWWVHFGVADCAAALDRITSLGGTPVVPLTDTGGGSRMASARDPYGAGFRLIEMSTWPSD